MDFSRRNFLKTMTVFLAGAGLEFAAPSESSAFFLNKLISKNLIDKSKYFSKIKNFDNNFDDDFILPDADFETLKSINEKLSKLLKYVGFGNFNVINYATAEYTMKNTSGLEYFNSDELTLINDLFYMDAKVLGFMGDKIFNNLEEKINHKHILKVPYTGHFIYKGQSEKTYQHITSKMDTLILTSGVRSVVKQMYLFYNKAVITDGNLSRASRSIAPVGHSYHGIGDFDVGIKGWGKENFTDKFASTEEFKELIREGYMRLRYDSKNPFGVRFEPWHVKVV